MTLRAWLCKPSGLGSYSDTYAGLTQCYQTKEILYRFSTIKKKEGKEEPQPDVPAMS
jgi:hypothetical protein